MNWLAVLRLRLRSLFRGAAADRELDEELQFHLERQVEQNIERGMPPPEARTAALRAIGGLEQCKEEMRDERRVSVVENLARDVRYGARQLRKQPGFAFTAIASLALGIGANTAIFQLLTALSLRSLPVRAPHELVEIRLTGHGRDGRHTGRNRQVSLPQYQELVTRQQAFTSMMAFGDTRFNLSNRGEVRYVDGLWVSGTFFDTLGIRPLLGRLIGPDDDRKGCGGGVAVISYALWQSEFGGRADIIGQALPGFQDVPIIGVTPQSFFGVEVGRQFGAALPICASGFGRTDHWWLATIGRLKPGWTREQAAAQLSQVLPEVQRITMPDYRAELAAEYLKLGLEAVDASSGVSPLRQSYQRPLWALVAISGLVLLMASVNLANLLLARATARQDEFAMRLALGGSRGRIIQQAFTESALVAALGGVAAVFVAIAVSRSIPPLMSTVVDRIHLELAFDWRIFGFTAAAGILTALIVGTAPAIRAGRASLNRVRARGSAGNDGLSLRRALVALQIAITLVLLFSGILFLRTFQNLSAEDTGVHERGVVVAALFFSERAYPVDRRREAFRTLDERIKAIPGVTSAAETYTTPMGGSIWNPNLESDQHVSGQSNANRISPRYFATLGTPLLAGRDFDERDRPGAPEVAIVNESFARKFFGGDSPLGHSFTLPRDAGGPGRQLHVVGLVADQKYAELREPNPMIFFTPSAQESLTTTRRYVVRSTLPRSQAIAAITATVGQFDPAIAIRYALLDTQIGEGMLQERLMARLSAIFGAVALLLAVVGLYGVVSYSVASRRAEIGVRVALGASRSRILGLILGDVGRTLGVGLAAGGVLALLAARAIASLLFGVAATDPMTLAVSVAVLALTGLLAAAGPAQRAARIDPASALRE
jgi:putative ABC transport system permease protein